MLAYQVKIEVVATREQEYAQWLQGHANELLRLRGFAKAFILRPYPLEEADSKDKSWVSFTTIYILDSVEAWDTYLEKWAPHFRADGIRRFGQDFRAERVMFQGIECIKKPQLDNRSESTEITSTSEGDPIMAVDFNWNKLRSELNKFTNIDSIKNEVNKIGQELKSFDVHLKLSPSAQRKIKSLEKKYADMMKSLGRAQRQVDREFNKAVRRLKTKQVEVEKTINSVKKTAKKQKQKIEKASVNLRKKVASTAPKSAKKSRKKATTKKTTTKKTSGSKAGKKASKKTRK